MMTEEGGLHINFKDANGPGKVGYNSYSSSKNDL